MALETKLESFCGVLLPSGTTCLNNNKKKTYYGLNPTLLTNHPKEFLRRKIRCSLINDMNGPPNTGINIQCRYSKAYIFLQINLIANIFQTDVQKTDQVEKRWCGNLKAFLLQRQQKSQDQSGQHQPTWQIIKGGGMGKFEHARVHGTRTPPRVPPLTHLGSPFLFLFNISHADQNGFSS